MSNRSSSQEATAGLPADASELPESRAEHIETGSGVTLSTKVWDGDLTPIVLAHGGGQTQHSWGATAAVLASFGHQVLTYDLRGHGTSSWAPDGDYSHVGFSGDAIAIADRFKEPVIWVGASLGGISGLMAIEQAPEHFDAVVLVDITNRPAATGVTKIFEFMSADVENGFASIDEAADAVAAYQPHRARPKNTDGLAKNLRLGEDGRWRWHWDPAFLQSKPSEEVLADRRASLDQACGALALPTLLIRGQLSDLVTDDEVREFLKLVPHASYVNVADAAHMVAGDKNDIFTSAILDFVAELDSSK